MLCVKLTCIASSALFLLFGCNEQSRSTLELVHSRILQQQMESSGIDFVSVIDVHPGQRRIRHDVPSSNIPSSIQRWCLIGDTLFYSFTIGYEYRTQNGDSTVRHLANTSTYGDIIRKEYIAVVNLSNGHIYDISEQKYAWAFAQMMLEGDKVGMFAYYYFAPFDTSVLKNYVLHWPTHSKSWALLDSVCSTYRLIEDSIQYEYHNTIYTQPMKSFSAQWYDTPSTFNAIFYNSEYFNCDSLSQMHGTDYCNRRDSRGRGK